LKVTWPDAYFAGSLRSGKRASRADGPDPVGEAQRT